MSVFLSFVALCTWHPVAWHPFLEFETIEVS